MEESHSPQRNQSEEPPTAERVAQLQATMRSMKARYDSEAGVTPEPPPETIGPYRILSVLGEGGMGTVYLAEQKQPVRRRVALKVIKLGMDSKQVLNRFEAERQALAMMEHSNIARVYEAGMTERGQPFFAMEHVKGTSITQFCDQHKLSLEERLDLFMQLCSGVQHAHQQRMSAIDDGDVAAESPEEVAHVAYHLYGQGRMHASYLTFAEAFDTGNRLLHEEHRYNAARAAIRAACGEGEDAVDLSVEECLEYSRNGRAMLQEELAHWREHIAHAQGDVRQQATWATLDPDLACVRDAEALSALDDHEAEAWRAYWKDVEALLSSGK